MSPPRRPAFKGLNLAMVIAAGVLCLIAMARANAETSCRSAAHAVGSTGCHHAGRHRGHLLARETLRADPDHIDAWAFIVPGAHAFSRVTVPLMSSTQRPADPWLDSILGGVPIYRIAPKNSDPSLVVLG